MSKISFFRSVSSSSRARLELGPKSARFGPMQRRMLSSHDAKVTGAGPESHKVLKSIKLITDAAANKLERLSRETFLKGKAQYSWAPC